MKTPISNHKFPGTFIPKVQNCANSNLIKLCNLFLFLLAQWDFHNFSLVCHFLIILISNDNTEQCTVTCRSKDLKPAIENVHQTSSKFGYILNCVFPPYPLQIHVALRETDNAVNVNPPHQIAGRKYGIKATPFLYKGFLK